MKTEIKILSAHDINDFAELINVFEEAFEMKDFTKPPQEHLQNVLNKPGFLSLVAKADNQVIGGLTAYIIDQYYSEKPLVYIYDLAVLEEYRRRGIAKSLIKYFTDFCKEKGFEEVFVQADRVDEEALSFYRSTGANVEEDVIHFTYSLK